MAHCSPRARRSQALSANETEAVNSTSTPTGSRITWKPEETEKLLDWMDENPLLLSKQHLWVKSVADEVFHSVHHLTAKVVKDKVKNMKKGFKRAKELQIRSGWGLKESDNEKKINTLLEKKCQYFWRLDALYGHGRYSKAFDVEPTLPVDDLHQRKSRRRDRSEFESDNNEEPADSCDKEVEEKNQISGKQEPPQDDRESKKLRTEITIAEKKIQMEEKIAANKLEKEMELGREKIAFEREKAAADRELKKEIAEIQAASMERIAKLQQENFVLLAKIFSGKNQ